ncbi:MAG: IS66 family transposase [Chryseolinea sp.]
MANEEVTYKEKYEELFVNYNHLRDELDQLKRLVYGSRHERFIPVSSPEQLALGLESSNLQIERAPITVQTIEYTREKKSGLEKVATGRMKLPANLPREQVIIEPEEDITGLKKIGEEITEELERIPGKLFVRQYIRPKYAKKDGDGIVIGTLPSRPIDKGIPGPGLLAQIVIDKYTDHLPIHRQIQRFEREGIKLSSSTLTDWIGSTCELLDPLYEALKKQVLTADYLQVDETPIKVLDKDKKGASHRGYHWVYHAPIQRMVLFDYREGRGGEGPGECLKDFKGFLQTDGYAVYENFDKKADITLLHCMAHARRKFDEAKDNDLTRASYVLTEMQKLYALERQAKSDSLTHEQRHTIRQQQAIPVLNALKTWMLDNYKSVLPKSSIGEALHYSLQRWDKLMLYATDGKLEIDNNLVENSIRPVAIGRKNYLFAGSHNGARRAAMLYSFLGTCKINDINPFEWLRDVLDKIPDYPINKISELLPNKM